MIQNPSKVNTWNQARRTMIMIEIESRRTETGPILMPSLWSAKKRISPAPAAGIGPSELLFFFDFGMMYPPTLSINSLTKPFLSITDDESKSF